MSGTYKAVRYLSPNNGSCSNVAEVEFYNGTTKLTGTAFGDAGGPHGNMTERSFEKAFDGNTATYYDASDPDNGYVGLTLTNCGTIPPACTLSVVASASAPACGASSTLSAALQGSSGGIVTYAWSGPNNFTSTLASPSLTNLTSAMAGSYSVTITQSGCTATASVSLSFTCSPPPPAPGACGVTKVRIFPRPDCCAGRTIGAQIQVSTTGSGGPWQTVLTVLNERAGQWSEFALSGVSGTYKAVRYLSPEGGYTNVAEVEFYNGATKLTGTAFGDAGGPHSGLASNNFAKAFDGNTASFYDGNDSNSGYVGLSLTNCGGATSRLAAEYQPEAEGLAFTVTASPNPSSGRAKVRVNLPEAGLVSLSVFNPTGQVMLSQERNGQIGENTFDVNYEQCPNGLYLLRVQSQGRKALLKLIKIQE